MIRPDKHYLYYLFLLVMEALIGALIIMSQGDRYMQLVYGLFAAIIYVVWGIIHHLINHTLHKKSGDRVSPHGSCRSKCTLLFSPLVFKPGEL